METENMIRLLLFFGGLFLGNKLAIGRDRRREFNEIATPIFEKLRQQEHAIRDDNKFIDGPSITDFEHFERHINFWKRRCFRKALETYNKQQDENRYFQMRNANIIRNADQFIYSIAALTKYTKRK